jgi:hypothetical protein
MPSFDVFKYVSTVLMIGVMAGGMMWIYDQIAPTFNGLIADGTVSHIGVQTMQVIYWSIVAYAPINLLFATVSALLVANARSETNSPLITTNFGSHVVLCVVIILAVLADFFVCAYLDPFIISLGSLAVNTLDTTNVIGMAFGAAHLLCAISVGVAYLYLIINSLRTESLQWSTQ